MTLEKNRLNAKVENLELSLKQTLEEHSSAEKGISKYEKSTVAAGSTKGASNKAIENQPPAGILKMTK